MTTPSAQQPEDVQLSLACDWSRHLPQLPGMPLSRLEHDKLLLRCFKYGTSWLLGIVPELFLHDMLYLLTTKEPLAPRPPRLRHYTPLLHCSIMAFATAFSDEPGIRAPATRARFADHAKQWLDEEFDKPGVSLLPTLMLLADYHCGIDEKEIGYMYMGMALRAARLLTSTSKSIIESEEAPSTFPDSVTQARYIWSAFAHDKLMAIEFRRCYDMPIPHSSVSLPSIDAQSDSRPWPPEMSTDSALDVGPARLTTLTFHESSKLAIIATRVVDVVCNRSETAVEERVILNIHLQLDTWFNNLPESLLVCARTVSPLPHIVALHIFYWWLLLVLHQPTYRPSKDKEKEGQTTMSGTEQRMPVAELSVKISSRAAYKIVQLLKIFDAHHDFRFFPRNMIEAIHTCGLALLRELASAPPGAHKKRSDTSKSISTCINALRTMSTTWPTAQPRADTLQLRLQEDFTPAFPVLQTDGAAQNALGDEEEDMDDAANISNAFYQHMYERGYIQEPHELESQSTSTYTLID